MGCIACVEYAKDVSYIKRKMHKELSGEQASAGACLYLGVTKL